ncbi:hypothetical protein ACXWOF_10140, partial [Streptococcus pyogenes]
ALFTSIYHFSYSVAGYVGMGSCVFRQNFVLGRKLPIRFCGHDFDPAIRSLSIWAISPPSVGTVLE